MKILFIHRNLPPDTFTGVALQVERLAEALCRLGHEVHILTLTRPSRQTPYTLLPLPLPANPLLRRLCLKGKRLTIPWLYGKYDYENYDIVHVHGDGAFLPWGRHFVRTFYGTAAMERNYSPNLKGKIAQALSFYLEKKEDRNCRIHGAAAVGISSHISGYLAGATRTIPCMLPSLSLRDIPAKSKNPSILFMGSAFSRKRGEWAMELYLQLYREFPALEFHYVGHQGDRDAGVFAAMKTEAAQNIRFHTRLSQGELQELYAASWIYLSLSSYEGFGVSLIEALAYGCFVVGTRTPGSESILSSGETGFIVDENNAGQTLSNLLRHPSKFEAIRRKGFQSAGQYLPENVAAQYLKIYQEHRRVPSWKK